ncbi:hypothetical protein [Halobellus sp. ZY16]|uniref:hypothetical protein n=1 Tax=Halobellus ordinarius TaxID=3075120 RepID=UPI002880176F|nr:hypothetical protein [Halobellus sp. ZY16]
MAREEDVVFRRITGTLRSELALDLDCIRLDSIHRLEVIKDALTLMDDLDGEIPLFVGCLPKLVPRVPHVFCIVAHLV